MPCSAEQLYLKSLAADEIRYLPAGVHKGQLDVKKHFAKSSLSGLTGKGHRETLQKRHDVNDFPNFSTLSCSRC